MPLETSFHSDMLAEGEIQPSRLENRTMNYDKPRKLLLLAAHPDDETIGCGGLLQRAAEALVVFAVDGAPPHYGFEKNFSSLQRYSELRFHEAQRALTFIPHCSFRRLANTDGVTFVDQHLFLGLPEAFTGLLQIARSFSPDVIVSHAFEGGHIDHDACHVLAARAGSVLGLPLLEFPLYWQNERGTDIFQQFRESRNDELILRLSRQEILIKQSMLAEFQSQANLAAVFETEVERFRTAADEPITSAAWRKYPFENRWRQLKVGSFLEKVAEFQQCAVGTTA
jgi:N-acetylglucosamine malate deacetylase 2